MIDAANNRRGIHLVVAVLLVAVLASAVHVVHKAHQVRELHSQLESATKAYNALLDRNTRLLLERGARASYNHIEEVAKDELAMRFPEGRKLP